MRDHRPGRTTTQHTSATSHRCLGYSPKARLVKNRAELETTRRLPMHPRRSQGVTHGPQTKPPRPAVNRTGRLSWPLRKERPIIDPGRSLHRAQLRFLQSRPAKAERKPVLKRECIMDGNLGHRVVQRGKCRREMIVDRATARILPRWSSGKVVIRARDSNECPVAHLPTIVRCMGSCRSREPLDRPPAEKTSRPAHIPAMGDRLKRVAARRSATLTFSCPPRGPVSVLTRFRVLHAATIELCTQLRKALESRESNIWP